MKLAFSTLGCPYYDINQVIEIALANGYQGIEIRAIEGTTNLSTLEAFQGAGLSKTAKQVKEANLSIPCIGTSIKFSENCKEKQQQNLEEVKKSMEMAIALGSPYIRIFGGPVPYTQSYTESMKWIWEGHNKALEYAKEYNISMLLETHDDFSTGARVMDIIDGVENKEYLGVLWDILHPYRFGEEPEDTYGILKEYIHHVHVKDSANFDPLGFDFPLLGQGNLPVRRCLDLLKNGMYSGYLSLEWEKLWHPEIPEPEVAIPDYPKAIERIMT